mmetsp:Transcript_7193/g.26298  ORF Transcript_7193/g.26298 Transcript_7193/m.26298 type:complete len:250 (-) Transcript_7193:397-1146(-)
MNNSTAFVGAMRATFNALPRNHPPGPSFRQIRVSVPTNPPSRAIVLESSMYSIFARSRGATIVRETPPDTAPTSKCFNTSLAPPFSTRLLAKPSDTSPTSTVLFDHTDSALVLSSASESIRKSRNSVKSIALASVTNFSFDALNNPLPLLNAPLPLLIRVIIASTDESSNVYPSRIKTFFNCLPVKYPKRSVSNFWNVFNNSRSRLNAKFPNSLNDIRCSFVSSSDEPVLRSPRSPPTRHASIVRHINS